MPGTLVRDYVASRVQGIGPERARRLGEAFGDSLPSVLSDESKVPAIAAALDRDRPLLALRLAAMAVSAWKEAAGEAATISWLSERGVDGLAFARRLCRILGDDAATRLSANPYCLVPLLPWSKVDRLGLAVLREEGVPDPRRDLRRLVGSIDAVAKAGISRGDTAISLSDLPGEVARLLGAREADAIVGEAIAAGLRNGALVDADGTLRFPGCATMEEDVVAKLAVIQRLAEPLPRSVLKDLQKGSLIDFAGLHPEQAAAVFKVLANPVSCLLGGAGVGKTHTTRAVCRAWEATGGSTLLAALSGKAALRLSRASGRLARTLARLLGELDETRRLEDELQDAEPERAGRIRTKLAALASIDDRTLIVIDEASMVDLSTLYRLLRHVPDRARILFVGDPAQLPPISFGLVYHRLVMDDAIAARLRVVHRQTEASGIPAVAAAVRDRRWPPLPEYAGAVDGVSFVESPLDGIPDVVAKVAADLGGFDAGELVVVTATNDGPAGVGPLNRMFQRSRQQARRLPVIKGHLGEWFSPGDPCIHLRNDYKLGLFNGSMGKVVEVDEVERVVVAEIDGRTFRFLSGDLERRPPAEMGALIDLALAYAVTCHKCQGSQAARVIVPVYRSMVLDPSWLYTAVTRAERQVVVVGERSALATALERPWASDRRRVGFDWVGMSPPASQVAVA
ncbi:MAG TPA: AAA family ATPase [Bosea sp. (in: a-proteobacteria)]|nr:AAA family ATPase [Bosea sp. (in: a-proteobacteria)]